MDVDRLVWIDGYISAEKFTEMPGWYVEINHVSQKVRRHAYLGNSYQTHASRWFLWKRAEEEYASMFADGSECIFSYLIGTNDSINRRLVSISPSGVHSRGENY